MEKAACEFVKLERDWNAIIEGQARSQKTAADFCREQGIVYGTFLYHRSKRLKKFFEATKASAKGVGLASEAIEIIRRLYAVEDVIKDKSIEDRYGIRQAESKPILDEFRKWLDDHRGQVPPQSQLGVAMSYAHNEWKYLIRYLDDGILSIDNNMVETTDCDAHSNQAPPDDDAFFNQDCEG